MSELSRLMNGSNLVSPYGEMVRFVSNPMGLVVHMDGANYRVKRNKEAGTIEYIPYGGPIGFSFSWLGTSGMVCSVQARPAVVYIRGVAIGIPVSSSLYIYAAAAFSANAGVVVLNPSSSLSRTNHQVQLFTRDSQTGVVTLQLIDTLTYETVNGVAFSKNTRTSTIELLVFHSHIAFEKVTYTLNGEGAYSKAADSIVALAARVEEDTFAWAGDRVTTSSGPGRVDGWPTNTYDMDWNTTGFTRNQYSSADAGWFCEDDFLVCDTTGIPTMPMQSSPSTQNVEITDSGGGGGMHWTSTISVDPSMTTYNETQENHTSANATYTYGFGTNISLQLCNSDEALITYAGSTRVDTWTSGYSGTINTTVISYGGGADPDVSSSGSIDSVTTQDSTGGTEIGLTIEFYDVVARVTLENWIDRSGAASYLFNSTRTDSPGTTHATQTQKVFINGSEVLSRVLWDFTTPHSIASGGHLYGLGDTRPASEQPAGSTSITYSYWGGFPPLGRKYAYTSDIYAVLVPYNGEPTAPPLVMFFPLDIDPDTQAMVVGSTPLDIATLAHPGDDKIMALL